MDAFTPQQTAELVSRIGTKKAHMRLDKLFWNAFMTGPLLGFGCAVMESTETAPWYQENAPGLIRTAGALMFPIGLVMITLTGADLFTSNVMFMVTAFLHRRVGVRDVLTSWVVSYLGNLAGMLFFMAIIIGYGGVLTDVAAYKQQTVTFAIQKAHDPGWHQIFLRAIGANWLVCMAVFLSISAREISSKIIAIWFPTATFVALALDHCIANMFFVPMGIWNGAPFGVGYFIWKCLIPTTLGNILGGGLFVGATYWYLYLTGEAAVDITFDTGVLSSAMEAGGPMRSASTAPTASRWNPRRRSRPPPVLEGIDASTHDESPPQSEKIASPLMSGSIARDQLPHSGGPLQSGIGRELSAERYAKRKGTKGSDGSVATTV
ncbi:MAG: hypothetical protein M1818_002895 [Claussenomyces sp. TS43310]|nr:MAG: hypothetical protein M1818_002895 [Claussenomyces sp. TS43310]